MEVRRRERGWKGGKEGGRRVKGRQGEGKEGGKEIRRGEGG